MTTTPTYGLTEWSAAQASPWVPENAAKRVLEAVGRGSVLDRDLDAAPGTCDDGACYLVAATPTGGDPWEGQTGKMAIAVGTDAVNGWLFATIATEGQFLWIEDEAIRIQYASAAWAEVSLGVAALDDLSDVDAPSPDDGDVLTWQDGSPGAWVPAPVAAGSGTVTTVSVASANGFAGSVANATTTPAITVSTSITGLLKGNGTAISAASAGTDYLAPAAIGTTVQAYDADLTTYASITPSANVQTLLGAANYSAFRASLGVAIGTDVKANAPSIQSVTSSATVTPTFSNDQVNITAQAAALALANPTGTAIPAWGLVIRIKDNGTARAISYDTQYRAIGVTLPTTTVLSKTLYLAMEFNEADTTWDVFAVAQQA